MTFDEWIKQAVFTMQVRTQQEWMQIAFEAGLQIEREACAKVCDADAEKLEQEAQRAIESGEHDEVSAIRSAAWKLSVAASRIRARSNVELTGPRSGSTTETGGCCGSG